MKRILVTEDEVSISNLISYNLEQVGYRVVTAFDGEEAIRLIESFRSHLLTLDLLLSQKSGWQVLDFIRNHPRQQISLLPVIVVSALTSPQLKQELCPWGVQHCLSKPFSITQLCSLVTDLLEGNPSLTWAGDL